MNNRGMVQDWKWMTTMVLVLILGGLTVLYAANALNLIPQNAIQIPTGGGNGNAPPVVQITQVCGSTGMGTINFREKNDANLTGTEWGNDALYVYMKNSDGSVGNLVGTVVAPGSSSYATLNNTACGTKLVAYVLSNATSTARITSVDTANGVSLNADGGIDIDMNNQNIYITAHKTGVPSALQFRLFDVDNNNYMYNYTTNATGHCVSQSTDWANTGVYFTGVTAASGAVGCPNVTVANNGQYTYNLYARATRTNGQFNADSDVIIGVQAAIGTWQNVVITGPSTSAITTSQLTPQEAKYFSNYQYFFKSGAPLANTPNTVYNIVLKAQPSVSTWKCPLITFAARGSYLGTTTGYMTLHSAAKDDSSYTAVYTVQQVGLYTNPACTTGT